MRLLEFQPYRRRVPRFRTKFLILDIYNTTNDIVVQTLSQILKVQTLERILVRPLASGAQPLRDRIRSLAETTRSPTIWFDDSFPANGSTHKNPNELHLHRHLSDAMIGDDLWLRGCQLYVPETDA